MKQKSRIPKFKTYEEEARFWDTHNVTDFEDETEDVEIVFDLDKPRDETVVVRMQKELKDHLSKLARSRGLNLSTFIRMWLTERVVQTARKSS